jgi:hypothetical protein
MNQDDLIFCLVTYIGGWYYLYKIILKEAFTLPATSVTFDPNNREYTPLRWFVFTVSLFFIVNAVLIISGLINR